MVKVSDNAENDCDQSSDAISHASLVSSNTSDLSASGSCNSASTCGLGWCSCIFSNKFMKKSRMKKKRSRRWLSGLWTCCNSRRQTTCCEIEHFGAASTHRCITFLRSTENETGFSSGSHHLSAGDTLPWNLVLDFSSRCSMTEFPSTTIKSSPANSNAPSQPRVHSTVHFVHCLVPDLLDITNCGFYWGIMNRYEAETELAQRPEGTFLLRDSAQEEFLFSVSFRRYGRSLHARIEQSDHQFSFDSHDSGVFAAKTVSQLIEHYKDPSCCMFFEPMLTYPMNRNQPFPLQQLCRAVICSKLTYDDIPFLPLPNMLKQFLQYYHYKQKV